MFSVSNRIFKQAIHRLTSNKIILKIIAGQSTKNSIFFYWKTGISSKVLGFLVRFNFIKSLEGLPIILHAYFLDNIFTIIIYICSYNKSFLINHENIFGIIFIPFFKL